MSDIRVGLLMNFHASPLRDGLRCFIVWPVRTPWSLVSSVLGAIGNPGSAAASTR